MTIEELRAEYRSAVVGPKLYGEIRGAVLPVARRYPPIPLYTGKESGGWDDGAFDDLTHRVMERLLASGHAELRDALDRATSVVGFRMIVSGKVAQALHRGDGLHTVVDNLVRRGKPLLAQPPFGRRGAGYQLLDKEVENRSPVDAELREAALRAALVPIEPWRPMSRASRLYTTERLQDVLTAMANALPCVFSLRDLDRVLSLILTSRLPGVPERTDERAQETDSALDPADQLIATQHVETITAALDADDKILLRGKLSNRSDAEMAGVLRCSRQTIDIRKKRLVTRLQQLLRDADGHLLDTVVEQLALALATERMAGG